MKPAGPVTFLLSAGAGFFFPMEEIFASLFNYRPFFFQKGQLVFQSGFSLLHFALAAASVIAVLYLLYRRSWPGRTGRLLFVLRSIFFVFLLLLLMRPGLTISSMVPRENILAVLVDNSASMGLQDAENQTRGESAARLLIPEADFLSSLGEKFHLRFYTFDSSTAAAELPIQLNWKGDGTSIASGLRSVLAETQHLPLGGILLLSDGSDNSFADFQEITTELKTRKVPVHAIGFGPESLTRDVELVQVVAPRQLVPNSTAMVRVTLQQQGFGGARGRLEVREGSALVQTREVHFPRNQETVNVDLTLAPKTEGMKIYQFTLVPLEGEEVKENNSRTTLVQVRDTRPRILYIEGYPRWEYKFIRQALSGDQHVRLETLLRTAQNKFYRQGIEEETTLATGFPMERRELFEYEGIVFGSIESSFFSYSQMEMVRDFVNKRGGGFLMLGGSSSFAAGRYQNTPIEEILPVWLEREGQAASLDSYQSQLEVRYSLTDHGMRHPALHLAENDKENMNLWQEMPELNDWNRIAAPKPGAVVLARSGGAQENNPPLLAFHRYGRGQGLALLTGSTWRWQMLQDHQNQTHETFWRQLLRWLAGSAKDPVTVETDREIYSPGETVRIRAEVNDDTFNRINDARVEVTITSPSGQTSTLPLRWRTGDDGLYEGQWIADEEGLFRIRAEAFGKGDGSAGYGESEQYFLSSTGRREYFNPVQNRDFLQRLTNATGGNYYTVSSARHFPEEVMYGEGRSTVVEVLDLWNMPFNFLFLMGLIFAEWILRKRHGRI
jgi:uncharacterized membrane protein